VERSSQRARRVVLCFAHLCAEATVAPKFMFVLPTTQCLAHCACCFYETGHSERVQAVDYLEPLGHALDALLAEGLRQVIITGGEPLLAPELPQLLARCRQPDVHLLLLTHGELLDEPTLAMLEQCGVDDITLSANDMDETLRRAVHTILFHSRYVPTLLTCLTRQNVARVPELLDFSGRRELPHLFTPAYVPRAAPVFERLSLHGLEDNEWAGLLELLGPWASASDSAFYLSMIRDFYRGLPVHPGFCPMGSSGLVVDADGTVYPCFHRHDLVAGNLLSDPWPRIDASLKEMGAALIGAPCFGEHCLSMFAGVQE
jgi:MoaA/NifB/PqqE/SkfB family radical SAM enzyme